MSLFEEFMEPCKLMARTSSPDGEGGFSSSWAEGASFNAAIIPNSGEVERLADKERAYTTYTVTSDVFVAPLTVFKRVSDGMTLRSVSERTEPPAPASFDFYQFKAERWDV